MDSVLLSELKARAQNVRRDVISMMGVTKVEHMASSLSAADLLVWLYGAVLSVRPNEPLWPLRDRFVLSKAAASPALYAVLAERGFFRRDELWGYRRLGSTLQAFADSKRTPGIDVSCGYLGMGPGISLGLALALKDRTPAGRVFCLMGDCELQEGAVWEALVACSRHSLGNLTLLVDGNESAVDLSALAEQLKALGWPVAFADGHDFEVLDEALASLPTTRARALIAKTVKGKGIPSLERGDLSGKALLNRQLTDELLGELEQPKEREVRDDAENKPSGGL